MNQAIHRLRLNALSAVAFCLVALILGISNYSAQQSSSNTPVTKNSYIGLRHGPKLPAGLKDEGGGLISDPYKDKVQYGIAQVVRGKETMLWFELLTHRNSKGEAFWEVLDVLTPPPIPRGQSLIFSFCFLNGKPDPEIIAIVDNPRRNSSVTRTRLAWRANRATRKFESMAVKGVTCEIQSDDPN